MEKSKLIILTGPTAVGKTELSIELAKAVDGEIISADSMQVYKYMDIGSAKITKEEMQGIRHYLVDCLSPKEEFNVQIFQKMAKEAIAEIYSRGKIPILVGGTGFYIQSIVYDIQFTENKDNTEIRQRLETIARTKGNSYLHDVLKSVDEASAQAIHQNNIKRVIRAIEFFELTGKKISEHNEAEREKASPYHFSYFVLNDERKRLYERIEARIDHMLQQGLVEEVWRLKQMGCTRGMVSMQGLGYKEILDYLNGDSSLEEAVSILKRDTRHFAKRQLTWFRRERDVIWIDKSKFNYNNDIIFKYMLEQIGEL